MRWPYICVPAASGLELLRTSDVVGLCTPGNLADTASKYTEPLMSEQSTTELRTPGSSSHILMRSPDGARLCPRRARADPRSGRRRSAPAGRGCWRGQRDRRRAEPHAVPHGAAGVEPGACSPAAAVGTSSCSQVAFAESAPEHADQSHDMSEPNLWRQVLDDNVNMPFAARVQLIDRRLQAIGVEGVHAVLSALPACLAAAEQQESGGATVQSVPIPRASSAWPASGTGILTGLPYAVTLASYTLRQLRNNMAMLARGRRSASHRHRDSAGSTGSWGKWGKQQAEQQIEYSRGR